MKIIADISGQGLVMIFATDLISIIKQINYEFKARINYKIESACA